MKNPVFNNIKNLAEKFMDFTEVKIRSSNNSNISNYKKKIQLK